MFGCDTDRERCVHVCVQTFFREYWGPACAHAVGPGVRNRPTSIGRDDDENPSVDGTLCINKPRGQVGTCYREERSE